MQVNKKWEEMPLGNLLNHYLIIIDERSFILSHFHVDRYLSSYAIVDRQLLQA